MTDHAYMQQAMSGSQEYQQANQQMQGQMQGQQLQQGQQMQGMQQGQQMQGQQMQGQQMQGQQMQGQQLQQGQQTQQAYQQQYQQGQYQQQQYQQNQQQYQQGQQYQQQGQNNTQGYDQSYNSYGGGQNSEQEREQAKAYMDYIQREEARDGVRLSWNSFPPNRIEGTRNVVPLALLYTPLHRRPNMQPINYAPLLCTQHGCKCVVNPYCNIDYNSKVWSCNFCGKSNAFPPSYQRMSEENKPAELHSAFSTIEYKLPPRAGQQNMAPQPPIFLFCIDTCVYDDKEFVDLKCAIESSLSLLPKNALVGFITFGKMVQIHELTKEASIPKSYVFRGNKDISAKHLKEMLGIGKHQYNQQMQQGQPMSQQPVCKFLQPLSEIESHITILIEELQIDPWPVPAKQRSARCTGVALSIATGLLEVTYPNSSARILSFISGPPTVGPGLVIDTDRSHTLRSWDDIDKDNATFVKKAVKHYKSIAVRAASAGLAIDLFFGSLDQAGLHEMKTLCTSTGGHLVMCDSFSSSLFLQTYRKMFDTNEKGEFEMGFNATMEIKTSRELKLQGVIGSCVSLNVKSSHVADEEIGVGGTSQYKICTLDPYTTYGVYIQVANPSTNPLRPGTNGFIQFATNYVHADGSRRVKVTTIYRPFADPGAGNLALTNGFDQEAATVLMARYATFRCERQEPAADVLRWLDRTLIRLCQKFGNYTANNPESFSFPVTMENFPQFMFNLRKTSFLNVFGHSPDETAYSRYQLCKQNMQECVIMIQPELYSYSLDGQPELVHLDSESLKPQRILLLDTFFHILIWHGSEIASWKKAGYHEQEQYTNLKKLLEAPVEDGLQIVEDRFPVPRWIETEEGGSQERFLKSKVNVSTDYKDMMYGQSTGSMVLSDDVNLQNFVLHLKKLAVVPN